jgi:hypothetical protein
VSTCRRWACSAPSEPTPISLVAVIAVTSVAANLSTIVAGPAVFEDRLGISAPVISVHLAAFALILVGAANDPSARSRR